MSVKNEFSKHANEYNSYNIIQQIIAKSLVRDCIGEPKRILELGCGSGQIIKYINWDYDYYKAIDFSQNMCDLHPKNEKIELKCFDFDNDDFFKNIEKDSYDLVISASALQWSKDLKRIVKALSDISPLINTVLFTSNTFKSIQNITNNKSPILAEKTIKDAFSKYCECEFETIKYELKFDNKKDLFDYIKKSGVSGGKALSFKDAKKLYKEYSLDYLEFEVIFIKAISKS